MNPYKTYQKAFVNAEKMHREIVESNNVTGFIGIDHCPVTEVLHIYADMAIDEELLDDLVLNHVISDPIYDEMLKFYKRQSDGHIALTKLMAELRLTALQNNYPRSVNAQIEDAYVDVIAAIGQGWWVTAKEKAELVPVGGSVTQQLWDKIHDTIIDYIAENY